jgi:hypothetical protein
MRYFGVVPTSEIPCSCVSKKESHRRTFRGKEVVYWEVWVKDEQEAPKYFSEDNIQPDKIKKVEDFLGIDFKKPK